jgi:hydrogenase nickel incorporation protein HypB
MEIKVMKNIMHANQSLADANRLFFKKKGVTAVNIMASPGAGKTTMIISLIEKLREKRPIMVIEGDIASSIDAEKIEKLGIKAVQINTGGGCHLDANMINTVIDVSIMEDKTLLFIENVGNLVCPSSFDLGETMKLVIASVPEGHDKPYKYIDMFAAADAIVLTKTDLLPYIDFDMNSFVKGIKAVNPTARIFNLSCKTGEGLDVFAEFINLNVFI